MKIADVTTYVVAVEAPHVGYVPYVFVKVDTDEGISGWGEAGCRAKGVAHSVAMAIDELKPILVGRSVTDIEQIWHNIYHRYTYFGSRGFGTGVAAGIDIALWDINGKATGRPVYDLLGGRFQETVPLYSNVWFDESCTNPEAYAIAAKKYLVDLGHSACKLDPFREMRPHHSVGHKGEISKAGEQMGYDIVAAVREVVGPDHDILIDAHGHYNVPTAIRLANNLYEQNNIAWFEEPVASESMVGLQSVREHTSAPICVGERLFTRYDFIPVLENRLADYIMPDTVWTGGITEIRKIASMADVYDIPMTPHVVPGGPLELLAAAHAMISIPQLLSPGACASSHRAAQRDADGAVRHREWRIAAKRQAGHWL